MSTTLLSGPMRLAAVAGLSALLMPTTGLGTRAAAPVSALRYTFTNSSTEGRKGREEVNLAGTGIVHGDVVRLELTAGGAQFFAEKGDYLLVDSRKDTITVVDVDGRRYFQLPTAMLQFGMAGMTSVVQQMVKLEVSDLSTRGEKVGAGPKIAGQPTTQYRVSQQYTLSATVSGQTTSEKVVATNDFYVASAVAKELSNPFMQVRIEAAQMIGGGTSGLGEIVRQIVAEQEKWFTGTPVKTVTHSTSVDEKGEETVSTATNQITSISRAEVQASMFVVPEGYALVKDPLSSLVSGDADAVKKVIGGKLAGEVKDAAADGAKQGLKDEVRRTTRDAVTKKVRGILRKP